MSKGYNSECTIFLNRRVSKVSVECSENGGKRVSEQQKTRFASGQTATVVDRSVLREKA